MVATVQLPGSKCFDTQITVHTVTQNTDVSLAQGFQKHLSNESRKHGIIDHGKHKRCQVNKSGHYHVQHNKDVDHQDVKIYCATNQLPKLKFLGSHNKPHGVCGLGYYYHMRFYPKLCHDTYEICCIPCDFTSCNYIIYQLWIPGLIAQKNQYQEKYH